MDFGIVWEFSLYFMGKRFLGVLFRVEYVV